MYPSTDTPIVQMILRTGQLPAPAAHPIVRALSNGSSAMPNAVAAWPTRRAGRGYWPWVNGPSITAAA
jgi:hypothetical protein